MSAACCFCVFAEYKPKLWRLSWLWQLVSRSIRLCKQIIEKEFRLEHFVGGDGDRCTPKPTCSQTFPQKAN